MAPPGLGAAAEDWLPVWRCSTVGQTMAFVPQVSAPGLLKESFVESLVESLGRGS